MGIKDNFINQFRKEFEVALTKKLITKNDSLVNVSVIANIINNVELTEEDVLHLISVLCKKTNLSPVIYTEADVKFVMGHIERYMKSIPDSLN